MSQILLTLRTVGQPAATAGVVAGAGSGLAALMGPDGQQQTILQSHEG